MAMQPLDVVIEGMTFVTEIQGATEPVPAPTDEMIAEAEAALKRKLPPSYIAFMQRAGSVLLPEWDLYWVGGPELTALRNLVIANEIEREHDESPLPPFLIAFCDDGNGDQYCFDTRTKTLAGSDQSIEIEELFGVGDTSPLNPDDPHEYPVVLWDREKGLSQVRDGLYVVSTNFIDWLKNEVKSST